MLAASAHSMDWNLILTLTLSSFFAVEAMYYAISAIGLNVQFGYTGLLNFGQAGFMAAGAYALGMTAHYFHWSFWTSIPLALVYAVGLGLLMGVPTLRLRADYLAIVTIAIAEVIRLILRSVYFKGYFGASDGINNFSGTFKSLNPFQESKAKYRLWPFGHGVLPLIGLLGGMIIAGSVLGVFISGRLAKRRGTTASPVAQVLWSIGAIVVMVLISNHVEYTGFSVWPIVVGWVLVALLGLFVWALMRSPWGRVLKAIREDEDAVRSLGKNVYSYKMQALILGGCIATFSGMMLALSNGSIQPDNYSRDVTFYVLTALVLGGAAKVSGSIVGPMLFWGILQFSSTFLNELFKTWGGHIAIFHLTIIQQASQIGQVQLMIVGLGLVVLMAFRPQGIFGNRKEMALDGR